MFELIKYFITTSGSFKIRWCYLTDKSGLCARDNIIRSKAWMYKRFIPIFIQRPRLKSTEFFGVRSVISPFFPKWVIDKSKCLTCSLNRSGQYIATGSNTHHGQDHTRASGYLLARENQKWECSRKKTSTELFSLYSILGVALKYGIVKIFKTLNCSIKNLLEKRSDVYMLMYELISI